MAQTIQILRTNSNTPPAALLPGALSAELGPQTKLWIGSGSGNRLLLSSDPADSGAAGSAFLKLAGGTMTGPLVLPVGALATLAMSFNGVPNVGLFENAGLLNLVSNGAIALQLGPNAVQPMKPLRGVDGTQPAPAFAFSAETNTGLFRKSTGSVSLSLTNSEVMNWNATAKTTTAFGPLVLAADPAAPLQAATKQYVDAGIAGLAPIASPAFTGSPTAPTPATTDSDTSIATTAFVQAAAAAAAAAVTGNASNITSGVLSAQRLDLGTRLSAVGTKLNALGPITDVNTQSAASTNNALDAALNYYSGASTNYEWDLPAPTAGSCIAIYTSVGSGTCTIRPRAGDQILAPGAAGTAYTNAAPLIIPPSPRIVLSMIVLMGRPSSNAWDILSASPEIHEALGWVSRPSLNVTFLGTAISIPSATWTRCPLDTVQVDSHGWWDAANQRYVPKRAGKYLTTFGAMMGDSGGPGPYGCYAAIHLNVGQVAAQALSWNGTTYLPYTNAITCTSIIPCNGTTDYIDAWCYVGSSNDPHIFGGGGCQLSIAHIGP